MCAAIHRISRVFFELKLPEKDDQQHLFEGENIQTQAPHLQTAETPRTVLYCSLCPLITQYVLSPPSDVTRH